MLELMDILHLQEYVYSCFATHQVVIYKNICKKYMHNFLSVLAVYEFGVNEDHLTITILTNWKASAVCSVQYSHVVLMLFFSNFCTFAFTITQGQL